MEKRFETRLEGFRRRQGSSLPCATSIYASSSSAPAPAPKHRRQFGQTATRYGRRRRLAGGTSASLPSSLPLRRSPLALRDEEVSALIIKNCTTASVASSEEGLRDLARVLEGTLEEARRKTEAGRSLLGQVQKRAKVGESGRQITSATPGDMVSPCNGSMINGDSVHGCVLDDQKKAEEGSLPESGPATERVEVFDHNLGLAMACDSGTNNMVSCSIPAMKPCNTNLANQAPWHWPDNSSFMQILMGDDDNSGHIGDRRMMARLKEYVVDLLHGEDELLVII